MNCRFCSASLERTFVDLGLSPLANNYPTGDQLKMVSFYPLQAFVCDACLLVQVGEYEPPEVIFSDYAYFSSYSEEWLAHCARFADMVTKRFDLSERSRVVELGSNDGYLLQFFADQGIRVMGIEPSESVARVAQDRGISTLVEFFDLKLALALQAVPAGGADLLVANNVLAHVPDLVGFVEGMRTLLKPRGVVTVEFPHLLRLIQERQFDTIYHEHFSYFSLTSARMIFAQFGLDIFDVDELPTHGGSLRIYAAHQGTRPIEPAVDELVSREERAGLTRPETYEAFEQAVHCEKREILKMLIDLKEKGKSIAGYGAPAKGNTLLNYCGIGTDFLDFTVDATPYKQGRFLPGTSIPITPPEYLREARPDIVFILPWNHRDEIIGKSGYVEDWGGRFLVRGSGGLELHQRRELRVA